MTPDYRPNLVRSFERHLRAENRSEHTIASYLESIRQAEAFLAGRGLSLLDARREDLEAFLGELLRRRAHEVEYGRRLRAKLLEEAHETAAATEPAALLEELGDVLQVLYALATEAGYSPAEVESARARKARTHGAYTRRLVWHDPTD